MQKKLFVFGSSNTDMVIKCERLPAPGETVIGGTFLMNPGGKGANQAVAAARLSGGVTFVCKVGNDVFGTHAVAQFQQEEIDTRFIHVDAVQPSGVALINVDANGENSIAVASGANATLSPSDVDAALQTIDSETLVLVQLEIPLTTVAYIVQRSAEIGAKVILNPAPAQPLPDAVLSQLYLISPNETEAEILTGIRVTDVSAADAAAQWLYAKGVRYVIVTLGSKGALIYDGTSTRLVPAPKVIAVDTTAAGDVFNGALAVAIMEGRELEESVGFACQAAALSVTRLGAQASAPYRNEIG